MQNQPTMDDLQQLPGLNTVGLLNSGQRIIYMHFSQNGNHWYAAEYDDSGTFFGFVLPGYDYENGMWDYFRLDELESGEGTRRPTLKRDPHWTARRASDVDLIVEAYRRQGKAW